MYDQAFVDEIFQKLGVQDKPWLKDLYLPGIRGHISKKASVETIVEQFKEHADKNRNKPSPLAEK